MIFTRRDGAPMTDEEVKQAAETYGAKTSLHYDRLIDSGNVYVNENGVNKSALVALPTERRRTGRSTVATPKPQTRFCSACRFT